MNKTLALVLGLVLVAGVVAGLVLPSAPDIASVPGAKGDKGDRGPAGPSVTGPRGPQGVPGKDAVNFGAVVGPDIFLPHLSLNNVAIIADSISFRQGTTTLCGITSPSATSTLSSLTVQFKEATSTIVLVDIIKTANFETFATSGGAAIGTAYELKANGNEVGLGMNTILASTTVNADGLLVFNPRQNLIVAASAKNLDAELNAADTFNLDGHCKVVWGAPFN